MAEFAQFRLEESLPEIQKLLELKLVDRKELKHLIRRMKMFEYHLQRNTKSKKDFLKYIEFEYNLLELVKLRRTRLRINYKVEEVEVPIGRRIKALYEGCLSRFKGDVELWLKFIDLLKEMNWKTSVGKQYAKMLRFHSDKPELWAAAAKFEFEDIGSSQVARKTLLTGIRFNKDSKLLYQKLFEMELELANIEQKVAEEEYQELKAKRKKIKKGLEVDEEELVKIKEAKMPSIDLRIAEAVYKNAIDVVTDVEFAVSFLEICDKYDYASELSRSICTDFHIKFDSDEVWRNTWAVRALNFEEQDKFFSDQTTLDAEKDCINRFEEAVCSVPTEKMWNFYMDFILKRLEFEDRISESKEELFAWAKDVFERFPAEFSISAANYKKWVAITAETDSESSTKVLKIASKRYPQDPWFYEERIRRGITDQLSDDKINKIFKKGLANIPSKNVLPFWKLALQWYLVADPDNVESFFENGLQQYVSIAAEIKVLYLQWKYNERGENEIWKLYKNIWSRPPISLEVFNKVSEVLEASPTPPLKRLRKVMEAAQTNFGKTNVDVWIQSMDFEKYASVDRNRSALIYQRAIKTLEPEMVDQFIAHHTLLNTNVLQNDH